MCRLLFLLVALATVAHGYVQLAEVHYEQLMDKSGKYTLGSSTANKVAMDDVKNVLYVIAKEPRRLTTFSVGYEGHLTELSNLRFPDVVGEPLDIEYCKPENGGSPRVAISFNDPENPAEPGEVRIYEPITQSAKTLGAPQVTFATGAEPVDIKFGQDCRLLLVANRARPHKALTKVVDEDGTVTKAMLPKQLTSTSTAIVTTLTFDQAIENMGIINLQRMNFRYGPRRDADGNILPVTRSIEPVNVEISANGMTGYVAMPKNNAIARLNLNDNTVSNLIPMGNRSWATFYMDASEADKAVHMENYGVYSTLQPRQLKWLVQGNSEWLVSLDSGFIDDIPEYNYYKDWKTGKQLIGEGVITGVDSHLVEMLKDNKKLGQARVSTIDGRSPNGNHINNVFLFGGRGISVHDGKTLQIRTSLVDNIERVSAQFYKDVFNTAYTSTSTTPQQDRETTSPTLGPNLSVMETGFFDDQKLLFLGSETSGQIYVYVLVPDANCPQPSFHSVHRRGKISTTWQALYQEKTIGDLGISDMLYLGDSQDHDKLLIVASSTSNSVSTYKVHDSPVDLRK